LESGKAVSLRPRCEQKAAPGCAQVLLYAMTSMRNLSQFLRPFVLRSGSSRSGGSRTLALLQPSLCCLSLVRHLPSRHGLIFLSLPSAALLAINMD
jgi:hypothetical protein